MSVDFSIFAHADSGLDHSIRNTAITATDVAKILGKSKYGSAWDVWAVKTGLVIPKDVENEAMEIGTYMQLPTCAIYQKRTGNIVDWFDKTIRHPDFPWMAATPDGLINQQRLDGSCGVYEGKTAGAQAVFNWGDQGTDQVPDEYLFQATWACMVTQRAYCDIAVLMGTQPLSVKIFHVEPKERFKALLFERMRTFWHDNVVARVPPPMFATETANEYLMQFSDVDDFREATDEEHVLLEELANLDAAPIKDTARIEDLKTRLRASIGTAAGLIGPWGKASYKRNRSTVTIDWEGYAKHLELEGDIDTKEARRDFTTERKGNRPLVVKFKKNAA